MVPQSPPCLKATSEAFLLAIHAVPGASRSSLEGLHGDRLKIRLHAPAREGAANRELLRYLAELLRIPRSDLVLVRGATSRRKTVALPRDRRLEARLCELLC